jgi:hypothetical protein
VLSQFSTIIYKCAVTGIFLNYAIKAADISKSFILDKNNSKLSDESKVIVGMVSIVAGMFNIGDSDIKNYIKDINKVGTSPGKNFEEIIDKILNYEETQTKEPEIKTMRSLAATTITAKDTVKEKNSIIAKYNLKILLYDAYLKQFQNNINQILTICNTYNSSSTDAIYHIEPAEMDLITGPKQKIDDGIKKITDYIQNITSDNFNETDYFGFKDVIDEIIKEYKVIAVNRVDSSGIVIANSAIKDIISSLNSHADTNTYNKAALDALNVEFTKLKSKIKQFQVPTTNATISALDLMVQKLLANDSKAKINIFGKTGNEIEKYKTDLKASLVKSLGVPVTGTVIDLRVTANFIY